MQNGAKKRGEPKDGKQMHVQIIVSRKDATNKIKLSPMNNSKGKNEAHSKKLGQFDRVAFKQSGETLFDEIFGFDRKIQETLAYANIQKNGNLTQKEQLDILEFGASQNDHSHHFANKLANDVATGVFNSTNDMLQVVGKIVSGFIELMIEPVQATSSGVDPVEEAEKKRRKNALDKVRDSVDKHVLIFENSCPSAHLRPAKTPAHIAWSCSLPWYLRKKIALTYRLVCWVGIILFNFRLDGLPMKGTGWFWPWEKMPLRR